MMRTEFHHNYLWNPDLGSVYQSPDRCVLLFTIEDIHPDCYGQTAYLYIRPTQTLFKVIEVANDHPTKPLRVQWALNSSQVIFEIQDCDDWRAFECGLPRTPQWDLYRSCEACIRFKNNGHKGVIQIDDPVVINHRRLYTST